MLLWTLIALLTAAAILAVLLPLGRRPTTSDAAGHMARVYRDQLAELETRKIRQLIVSLGLDGAPQFGAFDSQGRFLTFK